MQIHTLPRAGGLVTRTFKEAQNHPRYKHFIKCLITFFALIFLAISAYGLYRSTDAYFNWQPVQAKVLYNYITNDCERKIGRRNRGSDYELTCSREYNTNIAYTYNIGAEAYTGYLSDKSRKGFYNKIDAQNYVNNYKIGQALTVFYNPDNLSDSMQKPAFSLHALIIFLSAFFVIVYVWFGHRHREQAA